MKLKKWQEIKDWTSEHFEPKLVMVGVVIGFSLCVALGHYFATKNLYVNFHRLHPYISMDTQFLPTFSNLLELVKSKIEPGKTLVIVGGDSVFNGQGQTVDKLWSDQLQKDLGDKYSVINISFRGGRVFEGAYWIYEALSKEKHDVIFVANAFGAVIGIPCGNTPYRYMYWDGYYKGFMRDFPARKEFIDFNPSLLRDQFDKPLDELFLCMQLDKYLRFRDLWNVVSYRLFASIWTDVTSKNFLCPRILYKDIIPVSDTGKARDSDQSIWLNTVRKYSLPYFQSVNGKLVPNHQGWREFELLADCAVIPELRQNTLLVSVDICPFYYDMLSAQEQERHNAMRSRSMSGYDKKGYKTLILSNLATEDFIDGVHLSPSGGLKMASQVAAKIREIKEKRQNKSEK